MMTSGAETLEHKAAAWRTGDKILFHGDSITDAHRGSGSGDDAGLGRGYVQIIAKRLSQEHPSRRLIFVNRGVSGDQIDDLVRRWNEDAIALEPDILSILVGINDTGAETALQEFEVVYDALLERTKAALPNVRLVLCEPFALLPRSADGNPHRWETNVRERARIVEKLAAKYRAPFVRFQKVFDDALKAAPAEHWLYDGIHPTQAGHQLMADEWIRTVSGYDR